MIQIKSQDKGRISDVIHFMSNNAIWAFSDLNIDCKRINNKYVVEVSSENDIVYEMIVEHITREGGAEMSGIGDTAIYVLKSHPQI